MAVFVVFVKMLTGTKKYDLGVKLILMISNFLI